MSSIILTGLVPLILSIDPPQTQMLDYPGTARRNQIMFLEGDDLFSFGGNQSSDPRNFDPSSFTKDAFSINLTTFAITPKSAPPIPIMSSVSIMIEQGGKRKLLALGGQTHDGKEFHVTDNILIYDLKADRWETSTTRLPTPATLFGASSRGDHILVFGGWKQSSQKKLFGPPLDVSAEIASIPLTGENASTLEITLPRPRRSFACASIGSHTFLIGGLNDRFGYIQDCESFDAESQSFRPIQPPRQPRAMGEAVSTLDHLFLVAGFVSQGLVKPFEPITRIERYNPSENRWSTLVESLPAWSGGSATRAFVDEKQRLVLFEVDPLHPTTARWMRWETNQLVGSQETSP